MATAIVGANWGDEGKGKMTDLLAAQSDIVVRFQGGNNAGHTIINGHGRFALHLLPSGVCYPHVVNVIGPGVALNIKALIAELASVASQGVTPQLLVSDRAQVLLDVHRLFDAWEEERLGERGFGSTKSGIAPFYSDKYAKVGIQVCELFHETTLRERLKLFCDRKNPVLEHVFKRPPITPETLLPELREAAEAIRPYLCDTTAYLHAQRMAGKRILLEGQLGALKDPDHGIYPYVTSSSPLAGFASVGAGIPPHAITEIITVVKAYSSAVGAGPFVSEIFGDEAQTLRLRGGDKGEFGATTGRPRRMGWFDVVATRYGCMVQGATEVALALIDVLGYLPEIPVCVAYEVNGKRTDRFPATPDLYTAKPILERLPGWNCDLRGIRRFEDLPQAARDYVLFVEKAIGVPVTLVSNGPRREDIILRGPRAV
jgi:adenylosuccinate synthase